MEWIIANWGSILVIAMIALIVGAVIYSMLREKKKGKSSCSCGCGGCAYSASCPTAQRQNPQN